MSLVESYENTTTGSSTTLNDHAFTPSKDGNYLFVLFATGNSSSVNASCSTATLNTLIRKSDIYSGGCGALMVFTAKLKTTDTVNMTIKNAGGNGYGRRYYVYS